MSLRLCLLARVSLIAVLYLTTLPGYSGCLRIWGTTPGPVPFPNDLENAVAISARGLQGMALLPNGTVSYWGSGTSASVPQSVTNVIAIAAGDTHCVVARADGSVVCWGSNSMEQSVPPNDATNVVAVAAGERFSAALRRDGTVVAWGKWFIDGEFNAVGTLTFQQSVTAISAGDNHLVALLEDGSVECRGAYASGQSNPPDVFSDVIAVSGGLNRSLAVHRNGTVSHWGSGPAPSQHAWGIKSIASGQTHDIALRTNGVVVTWGNWADMPATVPYDLTEVVAVAAGYNFSVALLKTCSAPTVEAPVASPDSVVCAGTVVTLSQSATGGTPPYAYQWVKNGTAIDEATNAVLEVTSPADLDTFSCVVRSSCDAQVASEPITLRVNAAPAAPDKSYTRAPGTSLKIRAAEILSGLIFHSVGTSSQGAGISFDPDNIYYLPQPGNNNSDSFTYTVYSGQCSTTGTITISVESVGGMARQITYTEDGVTIVFYGIPGVSYEVQRSGDTTFQTFETVLTTNVPAGGEFILTEPLQLSGSAFYRLLSH